MKNPENSTLGNSQGSASVIVMVVMAVLYFGAFYAGSRGYGYTGYGGYHHGPSFFYWGGANTYYGPSARAGSVGGPGHLGGGTGGGK